MKRAGARHKLWERYEKSDIHAKVYITSLKSSYIHIIQGKTCLPSHFRFPNLLLSVSTTLVIRIWISNFWRFNQSLCFNRLIQTLNLIIGSIKVRFRGISSLNIVYSHLAMGNYCIVQRDIKDYFSLITNCRRCTVSAQWRRKFIQNNKALHFPVITNNSHRRLLVINENHADFNKWIKRQPLPWSPQG